MNPKALRKPLLIFCLLFSVALHGFILFMLFQNPLLFNRSSTKEWKKPMAVAEPLPTDPTEQLLKKMNRALEESFSELLLAAKSEVPEIEPLLDDENSPQYVDTRPAESLLSPEDELNTDDLSDEIAQELYEEKELLSLALETEDIFDMEDEFSEFQGSAAHHEFVNDPEIEDYTPSLSLERSSKTAPLLKKNCPRLRTQKESPLKAEALFNIKKESLTKDYSALTFSSPVDYLREEWIKRSLVEHRKKMPDLSYYGLEELASVVQWDENLEIEVTWAKDPENDKYIFSLTFQTDFVADVEKMHQNYYFIIDRSNSIEKFRYEGFKRAVRRSLSVLQEGDHFNICIIDKQVARLSDKSLPVTTKTLHGAEEFLDRQEHKSFFNAADLYTSLDQMIPYNLSSEELHSIILLSDGNTSFSSSKQKKTLNQWLEKNKSNVIVYTAASGRGNNLVLLDLLSYTTSGKLLYSDTNASFPRKLVKLVKDLQEPLIKNISVEATAHDTEQEITLFPSNAPWPPLFSKKPYVIVGETDTLQDFTLYVQGRNRDQWLNIKKTISFKDAKKGGKSLEKLWATAKASLCYERFLKEGKGKHLKEAKNILAPYRGTICLE